VRHISIVLSEASNDKEAFQTAVRMAARERASVGVVLSAGCSREMFEKHLDFVLWDVRERLRLAAPEIRLEPGLDGLELEAIGGRGHGSAR
jgi:hypothetical protein